MIFITGDTHIPIDTRKLNTKNFPQQRMLSKKDYLIICGDFGGIWDNGRTDLYWQKWLDAKSWTTLFVDGNHENFELLNEFPTVRFKGGQAHKINNSIYHLKRGQIFTIEDKTFFTMGGASSHDKHLRKEHISWWKEEIPSDREFNFALKKLQQYNWSVDYVITHCAPDSIQGLMAQHYEHDRITNFLEVVNSRLKFKHWYFGHYHTNAQVTPKHTVLYESIIQI